MQNKILIGIGALALGLAFFFTNATDTLMSSLIRPDSTVTLQTNHGDIKIQLYADKTPKTARNFYELAKRGKYDDSIFHRVIDGFMIQGGDYENHNGTGGSSIYDGGDFEDEFATGLSNVRGAISMANRGPGTNGSQFFIVHKDAVFLDGRHSVFGQVVEGMEVVDKIANVKTDLMDAPLEKVVIKKAIAE